MSVTIRDIVNDELAVLGFERRGLTWHKHFTEVIHVVDLQKSLWGKAYYINLAIWVNKLGESQWPKSQECHLQVRATSLSENSSEIDAALDEEDYSQMDSGQRRDLIRFALCNAEFAFFRELTSLDAVKRFVRNKPRINLAVKKSLSELLEENRAIPD